LRAALEELSACGLLDWSEACIAVSPDGHELGRAIARETGTSASRPVPIPRRIIRLLARHGKPSEVVATLAHLIRCLFKRGRTITTRGFVRAEWVARVFGVSLRAVYGARRWLSSLGVLDQVPVHQLVMNRHGALFRVAVEGLGAARREPPVRGSAGPLKSTNSCTSKNQNKKNNKPAGGGGAGVSGGVPGEVSLRAIRPEDLRRVSRLERLYTQAVRASWLPHGEASARNFVAAAVRATRAGGDPARIFVGIVRRGLWHHITQQQENRALEALASYRRRRPDAFRLREHGAVPDSRLRGLVAGLLSPPASSGLPTGSRGAGEPAAADTLAILRGGPGGGCGASGPVGPEGSGPRAGRVGGMLRIAPATGGRGA
jgi:hypothetical protein